MRFPLKAFFCALVAAAASPSASAQWGFRIPTPFGDVQGSIDPVRFAVSPLDYLVPVPVPTVGDAVQFAMRNPDGAVRVALDPSSGPAAAVTAAIVAGRNDVLERGGARIPDHVRQALRGWYTDEFMEGVRWSTNWNLLQNSAQAALFFGDRNARAITLMNVVVFRDLTAVNDIALWAHELHHVRQYQEWGVFTFAERWLADTSNTSQIELPAYQHQEVVEAGLATARIAQHQQLRSYGDCRVWRKAMALCDLYASTAVEAAQFTVSATAEAVSDGTRRGRMQFIMISGGAPCNSGASTMYGVDNNTKLTGSDYVCAVRVQGGQLVRVLAIAPNWSADAVYTVTDWRLDSEAVRGR